MRLLAALLLFSSWMCAAHAQPYPAKPIRLICAFPVGGIADIYGRIIAAKLGDTWAPNTPEQFSKFVLAEIAKWAPVVKASGARVD